MLLVVVVGLAMVLMVGCGGGEQALTVLAMNEDPEASTQAVLYVGDPGEQPFDLPQGEYSLLAMDGDGDIAEHHASLATDGLVPLSEIEFGSSATEEERVANRENMGRLVEFFAVNEYAVFSYLERMLRTGGDFSDEDVAAQFQEIAQLQVSLENGMRGLQYFAQESSDRGASPLYVRAMAPTLSAVPPPAAGKIGLARSWWEWAKSLRGSGEDTRNKVAEGMAALPDDNHRQQLLNGIDPDRRQALGIPDNVADFLAKLNNGELDNNANQIHQELCTASVDPEANLERLSNYYDHAQTTGSRPIDQAYKHGTEMVDKGKDFYLDAVKTVIEASTGSSKAVEYVMKAIDKGSFIYDLLTEPGETLTKKKIEEVLEAELKDKLKEFGIPEDEVDDMIEILTDKIFDKLKEGEQKLVEEVEAALSGKAVLGPPKPEAQEPPPLPALTVTPSAAGAATSAPATPTLVPTRKPTAAPATGTPEEATPVPTEAPDTGWIEGFVQGIADQWLAKGHSGIDVAVYADDLRQCLTGEVMAGVSRDEAIAACPPSMFEPAEETPQPTQAPTAAQPPGGQVTAVGQFIASELTANYLRLEFSTAGGPVTGVGRVQDTFAMSEGVLCYSTRNLTLTGQYYPDTGHFEGQYVVQAFLNPSPEGTAPAVPGCDARVDDPPYPWEATLAGNTITGWIEGEFDSQEYRGEFSLTVQGN